jgi:hypothetical protein
MVRRLFTLIVNKLVTPFARTRFNSLLKFRAFGLTAGPCWLGYISSAGRVLRRVGAATGVLRGAEVVLFCWKSVTRGHAMVVGATVRKCAFTATWTDP